MSTLPRSSPAAPEKILRRLEWTVIRRLDGMLHGDYRSLFRGNGLDLADLRRVTRARQASQVGSRGWWLLLREEAELTRRLRTRESPEDPKHDRADRDR